MVNNMFTKRIFDARSSTNKTNCYLEVEEDLRQARISSDIIGFREKIRNKAMHLTFDARVFMKTGSSGTLWTEQRKHGKNQGRNRI